MLIVVMNYMRWLFVLLMFIVPKMVDAKFAVTDVYGGDLIYAENIVVESSVKIHPDNIYVKRTINIENNGEIKSNIYLGKNCDLYIRNRGVIDARFYMDKGANLYQVISDACDVNNIGANKSFTAIIDSNDMLKLSDLIGAVGDATKVVFNDSFVDLDVNDVLSDIEINGNLKLRIDDLGGRYGNAIFKNVSGNGTVQIVSDDTDELYSNVVYMDDDDLYLKRIRETDYLKILKNDSGVFLNELRRINPDDDLLIALDRSESMSELLGIMRRSVRFNSDILMHPMRVINWFDVTGVNSDAMGFVVSPEVILSDDFVVNSLSVGFNVFRDGMYSALINIRSGVVEYGSDIDEFMQRFVGGNINLRYWFDDIFVRLAGGIDVSKYDVGNVFYENKILNNPDAVSMYSQIEFGHEYNFNDSFYLVSNVGVFAWMYNIDDVSKDFANINVGIGAGYTFDMLGIHYDYSANIKVSTDNETTASLRAAFWSDMDAAGADFQISATSMFDVISYKLSLNGRIWL